MAILMGVVNLTPDSFWVSSRTGADEIVDRIRNMVVRGAEIIDLGAVSTRPGAAGVSVEEEWRRLEPALRLIAAMEDRPRISIDTVSSLIVERCHELLGDVMVNDISAGEDDPLMLQTVGRLGLTYVAMHKRGNPQTMDGLTYYPEGVMPALKAYFKEFSHRAEANGIRDWILDPGLGFAKTPEQCWEILYKLQELKSFGRPILVGAGDKRFTQGDSARADVIAVQNGADILRVHL